MAERRMFAKMIIDSDTYLDMPQSTQNLYFHLAMRADDDGFINNPKKIMRMIGSAQNDLELLLAKRYLLSFDSGIVVVKHWCIHNYIQKDRYHETKYLEEKSTLKLQENKAYTEVDTGCIQDGYPGKARLGKSRLEASQGEVISHAQGEESKSDYVKQYCEIKNHWNKETGQSVRKDLHEFGEDTRQIINIMAKYTEDEINTAITNWVKHKDFKDITYGLPGFIKTGVEKYLHSESEKKPKKKSALIEQFLKEEEERKKSEL